MILKFQDFYESLGVVVEVKRDRDNGYQVAESVMGVGKTGLLSTMAVHVTEGSAQTVSTPEVEERAGAQNLAAIGPQLHSQGVAVCR